MRATHTRLDYPVLIDDPWGERLILAEEREAMRERFGVESLDMALRAHPAYGIVILRSRVTEDALADGVTRGLRQYVIVGAGMDSFGLRRPSFARDLEIFEVDHPATQTFKMGRLQVCGISRPPGVHLVSTDLSETRLDAALAGSAFSSDTPSFFAWLGVTIYLSEVANLATLAAIASCAPKGSELVFDYADQAALDSSTEHASLQDARDQVASAGEPWVSGFHPARLTGQLHEIGLELIEDLGADELQARYCEGRSDGLAPSLFGHIAHARVAG